MNSKQLKAHIPHVLSILSLAIFAYYLFHNADRYQRLLDFSATTLLMMVVLVLITMMGSGLINLMLYRTLGSPVSLNEALGLAAVNTLANQLPFSGGMIAKGAYLKKRYRLPLLRFFSATLALYLLFLTIDGLTGLLTLGYLSLTEYGPIPPVVTIAFVAMTGSALVLKLPVHRVRLPSAWERRVQQMLAGWEVLQEDRPRLLPMLGVNFVMTFLFAGRLWIMFNALSQDISFGECVLFSAATILTQLVSITPGGLGVREGIVAALAASHGIAVDVSIVAVGIDRLIATTVVIGVGSAYSYHLSRAATTPINETDGKDVQEHPVQEGSAALGASRGAHAPEREGN